MACQIISSKGAVFVLWGKPEKGDMDLVLNRLRMTADMARQPVVYITRVPVNSPPPDSDVRAHLNAIMPEVMAQCSSYHVVLEGTGFVSAVKRGVLVSLLQIGWRKGVFHVHATSKQVALKVEKEARQDVEAILRLADSKGLLTATEPPNPEVVAPHAA